jgi:hypothetical protein
MFSRNRIEHLKQTLNRYYSQVIEFQDKELPYQDIFKDSLELNNTIEDIRKYNNNINDQIINLIMNTNKNHFI